MNNFEALIENLDLKLFEKILSQSTEHDKKTLLAIQSAVRELNPNYNYLEIGSYLGGSIQPHLLDDKCAKIYSIDKRPPVQPDARGIDYAYENNSTERMLEKLKTVSAEKMDKIVTIDGDSGEIPVSKVADKIDLCFIDGEHTDEAVLRDFKFCLNVLKENGAICFHDSQITYNGIANSIKYLEEKKIAHRAYILPNIVFVIEIGNFPLHKNPKILERLIDNHHSYIFSLQNNDEFRRFANKFPFRQVRNLMVRMRKGHISR
ncbi:MAG TPA: class I SAM-dependent methyltransferase [Pyrinomonadaceae bacterium]|nr:class I SAM-dependent methyltransferase [Pyrinomonadaceae bacterium]